MLITKVRLITLIDVESIARTVSNPCSGMKTISQLHSSVQSWVSKTRIHNIVKSLEKYHPGFERLPIS